MTHASRADQLALVEIADFDSRIARLERENAKHPRRQELAALLNTIAAKAREKESAQSAYARAQEALKQAEQNTARMGETIAAKEAKLNSGVGLTSRDLLVLQGEIEAMRKDLNAASDSEFAALETSEAAAQRIAQIDASIAELDERVQSGTAELEKVVAQITSQAEQLRRERQALFSPLNDDLKRIYEHSRASGGYAVIAMYRNGATEAGVQLSPVEVAQIRALPEDEICLSQDYDAIVVRLEE